ncbi:MAG: hypothetical protein CL843_04525 [Crocinitomicaceae bacterium]|nr:hypothetical protein [Crocinitomicaceae bacterium]|tara:strand:- start:443 stop:982 length:540 start_codon:yes stop_codon:yes gene_type:complete
MIQRIQSLFLLVSLLVVLSGTFAPIISLKGDFKSEKEAETTDRSVDVEMSGFYIKTAIADLEDQYNAEMEAQLPPTFPLGLGYLVLVILNGFIIINPTDRVRQMKLIVFSIVLHVVLLIGAVITGNAVASVVEGYNSYFEINYFNWGLIALPVSIVLCILARIFIKKDEELVRSVDRIR